MRTLEPPFRAIALRHALTLALLVLALMPDLLHAQSLLDFQASPTAGGGTRYSVPIQTLLIFSALSFLPAIILLMTSFTRIVIVLALLRQALGLQASPPNQVIVGMALFLTLFVMGSTLEKVYQDAYRPYVEENLPFDQAIDRASAPLRTFMLRQTRPADIDLFTRMQSTASGEESTAQEPAASAADPKTISMRVLIPAFVISELKTAFQISFLVFVPFLMIDLIVASVLMSMGMMMLSPVLVALPFKLMLFVLADGWNVLLGSLVASF